MASGLLRVPVILGRRTLVTSVPRLSGVTTTGDEVPVVGIQVPVTEEENSKWLLENNPPAPAKKGRNAHLREKLYTVIGNRDIVGPGVSGFAEYIEAEEFPFPAVRFMEPYPEIMPLLEKEKGDWKNLSIDEKKTLYRYSYRQTLKEEYTPEGLGKRLLIGTLFGLSCTMIYTQITIDYIFPWDPRAARTRQADWQGVHLGKLIAQNTSYTPGDPYWDYDKGEWRK
ncbi:cytochrome c oxidase subunit 4 isoform 1, mitochondrial [Lingula anatina]|uniref:Cytochrome c oxidase subunit 4 isoform 1, mitochondrial n=1 Tax=Lingula anatina TaxID=7574 RepID=A0A1S3J2D8_LINAN|nr:cytochrome c oxidase subunit 4 isoform 1, mitochondrial [Lingula anatina]|eukprot:XP_013404456.1 cytochrome c oxidase subunit 4 isoform 1, mitochondrial [Lingula anatina]